MKEKTKREPVFESLESILERVKTRLEKRRIQWETYGRPELPFGIPSLDLKTLGIEELLTIIGSRTSEGKTAFATQTACCLADSGKRVLYITIEDTTEHIVERMLSHTLRLDNQLIKMGKVKDEHYEAAKSIFANMKFLALGQYGFNWGEVRYVLDSIKDSELKPDIVFFDYIQNIETTGFGSRYEAMKEFTNQCVVWNGRNHIPMVLLSQINREAGEHEIPNLRHFEQGGAIEQSGYMILILHQPWRHGMSSWDYSPKMGSGMERPPKNYVECRLAKNKSGEIGMIPLKFTGRFYLFEDWEPPLKPQPEHKRKDIYND